MGAPFISAGIVPAFAFPARGRLHYPYTQDEAHWIVCLHDDTFIKFTRFKISVRDGQAVAQPVECAYMNGYPPILLRKSEYRLLILFTNSGLRRRSRRRTLTSFPL